MAKLKYVVNAAAVMVRTLKQLISELIDYMVANGHLIYTNDHTVIIGREPPITAPILVRKFYIRLATEKIRSDFLYELMK